KRQELDLQTVLGVALVVTRGGAAAEVVKTLAQAQTLAEQLNRSKHMVSLMLSQWSVHSSHAEHRLTLSLSKQIEDIGEVRNDAATQGFGRLLPGMSLVYIG